MLGPALAPCICAEVVELSLLGGAQAARLQCVTPLEGSCDAGGMPGRPTRVNQAPNPDSRLGLDRLGRRMGRSPGQPTTHIPADLNRNRKGAPSPPRSNGQAFDEASNPVTVAGRRCRASGRVRPCWDQAFPCCSPLTGRASGPLAASRPSRPVAALSYLTEGGRVPLGSVDWQ